MLPFYSDEAKKYEDEPFTKLGEEGDKIKVRFMNGFEKWVSKGSLKKVEQNEQLTLETYRKTIKKIEPKQDSPEEQQRKREVIEKINIDRVFLEGMLSTVFNRKKPRQEVRQLLRE